MNINSLKNKLRKLLFLPYSIVFNFHYLPLKQAVKIPILFACQPTFVCLKGKVILDTSEIKTGMITMGIRVAPIEAIRTFRWQNAGTIVFKGICSLNHHTFISCSKEARIEIGANSSFSSGLKIITANQITFGEKARISWNCTFMDTDWHPIIDLVSNKTLPVSRSIVIGRAVWIGHDCIVSKGSKLPDNSIIASGSVVKGYFKSSNTIIGGNPAKVLDEGFSRDDV